MSSFILHTLGCGSAKPSLRHNPSSTVLSIRDNLYMIDCGEGTQLAFQHHRLKLSRLNHIFLTHLHGDHCLGIPGLICSLSLLDRGGKITIHTFAEGAKILQQIINYFNHYNTCDIEFNIITHSDAVIFENDAITVRTIPLNHRLPDVGFVFTEKEKLRHINREMIDFHKVPISKIRSIKEGNPFIKEDGTIIPNEILTKPASPSVSYAHISDTSYMPEIAEKIGAVDLLFHESTYLKEHASEALSRGHSTAYQAAMTARDAGAKQLLLGHYSSRYKDDNLFLEEAKEIFPNVILNHERLVLPLD